MTRGGKLFAAVIDPGVIASTVLVVAILAGTSWLFFFRAPPKQYLKDGARTTVVLRCSECGDQIAYNQSFDGTTCDQCEYGTYASAVETASPESTGRVWGKYIAVVLIAVVAVSGWVLAVAYRARRLTDPKVQRKLAYLCPFCRRKVSYPAVAIGTVFVCSACKTAFVLPAPDEHSSV